MPDQRAPEAPLNDPLQALLGYQLRRLSAMAMADLATGLGELGVKTVEASVLLVVDANPGAAQSAVAKLLAIQSANMAPLAVSLAKRKLIRRTPADGRSYNMSCTDAGAALVQQIKQIMGEHEDRVCGPLDAGQRLQLLSQVTQLRQSLEQGWGHELTD